jgi:hypothetical protein
MKKFIGTLALIALVFTLNAQDKKTSPAVVEKVSEIPFFILSTPDAEYEMVGKAVTAGNIISLAVDENSTVSEKAVKLVNKALERVKKEKVPEFDAIIVDLFKENSRAIKFKNGVSTKAKVKEIDNVPVYFFSKPVDPYEEVGTLPADFSLRAERGMLLDKIESMINRTIKKAENGEIEKFDAVIISPDDLSLKTIRFK